MFKVVCVNDLNRPNELPTSHWVKRGKIYTVIQIDKMKMQGGKVAFKLEEINNDDYFPWTHFSSERFIPLDLLIDMALKNEKVLEEFGIDIDLDELMEINKKIEESQLEELVTLD